LPGPRHIPKEQHIADLQTLKNKDKNMLPAEEMYDVLVTILDTMSEVNIWRQISMTINLSSSTILTYDTRHTTEVYHSSMWSVLEGG
jgi:hypothetical protein